MPKGCSAVALSKTPSEEEKQLEMEARNIHFPREDQGKCCSKKESLALTLLPKHKKAVLSRPDTTILLSLCNDHKQGHKCEGKDSCSLVHRTMASVMWPFLSLMCPLLLFLLSNSLLDC